MDNIPVPSLQDIFVSFWHFGQVAKRINYPLQAYGLDAYCEETDSETWRRLQSCFGLWNSGYRKK